MERALAPCLLATDSDRSHNLLASWPFRPPGRKSCLGLRLTNSNHRHRYHHHHHYHPPKAAAAAAAAAAVAATTTTAQKSTTHKTAGPKSAQNPNFRIKLNQPTNSRISTGFFPHRNTIFKGLCSTCWKSCTTEPSERSCFRGWSTTSRCCYRSKGWRGACFLKALLGVLRGAWAESKSSGGGARRRRAKQLRG